MEINKEQVNAMIEQGQKRGLTGKNVIDALIRKGYTPEGVDVQAIKQSWQKKELEEMPKEKVSFGDRLREVAGDIGETFEGVARTSANRAEKIAELETKQESGERSALGTTLKQTGQALGAGADAIGEAFKGAIKIALPQEKEEQIKNDFTQLVQQVAKTDTAQWGIDKWNGFYEGLNDTQKEAVDAIGGVAALATEFIGTGVAKNVGKQALQRGQDVAEMGIKVGKEALDTTTDVISEGAEQTFKAGKKALPKSEDIMNRVARLTPTQARKFEAITGKTHGQYLKETGNFGTPDEIIARESEKFAQSVKSVDDSLAQLEGDFQEGIVDDVLEELQQKAISVSTKNVPAPYLERVNSLIAKNQDTGLSMSEINELKRLYERNVKLGYNKLVDAEKIQRATNLDNALREWQVAKADELGFSNLKELNKQTQASKQLINSLGEQVVGKSGLSDVTLTDWIILSGGDPTAVGGFLTKKFFSSKKVQSKIAEWLNDIEVKPLVEPKITPTKPSKQQSTKK